MRTIIPFRFPLLNVFLFTPQPHPQARPPRPQQLPLRPAHRLSPLVFPFPHHCSQPAWGSRCSAAWRRLRFRIGSSRRPGSRATRRLPCCPGRRRCAAAGVVKILDFRKNIYVAWKAAMCWSWSGVEWRKVSKKGFLCTRPYVSSNLKFSMPTVVAI